MSDQPIDTESRRALHELIGLLGEVDQRWASPEWNLHTDEDVFGAHRALMHMLQWGLVGLFERDPAAPDSIASSTPTARSSATTPTLSTSTPPSRQITPTG